LVAEVVAGVLASGRGVAVGCAAGTDGLVRSAVAGAFSASALAVLPVRVFPASLFPASSVAGSFARRSAAVVRFVAASGLGAEFIGFPLVACPAGLRPSSSASACFCGLGAGTWATLAFAAGLGLPVLVFPAAVFALPAWPGGAWSAVSGGSLWESRGQQARLF
jgi:hypothetical protein